MMPSTSTSPPLVSKTSSSAVHSSIQSSPSPKMKRSASSPSVKFRPPAVTHAASSLFVKIRRGAQAISPISIHSRRPSDASQTSSTSSGSSDEERDGGNTEGTRVNSPPSSPSAPTHKSTERKSRIHRINGSMTRRCSSGPPQSNPDASMERVEYKDTFVCTGGVNLPLLLRATKGSLIELVENRAGIGMGYPGNKRVVLHGEEWKCTITGPPPPTSPSVPSSPPANSNSMPIPSPLASKSPSSPPPSPTRIRRSRDSSSGSSSSSRKYKVHIHYIAYATISTTTIPSGSRVTSANCMPVALERAKEECVRGLMTIISRKEPGPPS